MHTKQRIATIGLFGGLTAGLLATMYAIGSDPPPVTAQVNASQPTYCCVVESGECEQIGASASSSSAPAPDPAEDEELLEGALQVIPEVFEENMRTILDEVGTRTYPYVHKQIRSIREALDALPEEPEAQIPRIRELFDQTMQLRLFHQMYAEAAEFIPNRQRDLQGSIDNMNRIIDDRNFYSCWAWKASVCRSEDAQRDNFVERLSVTNREAGNIYALAYDTNNFSLTDSMSRLRRSYGEISRFGTSGLRDVFRAEGEATAAWVRAADNTITGIRWTRTAISLALTVYPPGQKLFDGISNGMDILTGQVTVEEGLTNAAIDLAAGRAVGVGGRLLSRVGPRGVARLLSTASRNNPRTAAAIRNALENAATDLVAGQIRSAYDELRGTSSSSSAPDAAPQDPVSCAVIDSRYADRMPVLTMNQCRAACRIIASASSAADSSAPRGEPEPEPESEPEPEERADDAASSARASAAGRSSNAPGAASSSPAGDAGGETWDEFDFIPASPADCIRYGNTNIREDPRWMCDPYIRGWK